MSYAEILAGLHERLGTVEGIVNILAYEPTAIHDYPTLYSLLDSWQRTRAGQVTRTEYRTLHRLLLRWQDNERAAAEAIPYVDSIPAAVDVDPHLGGRIASGYATIDEGSLNYVEIAGAECLAVDFYSTVIVKE